jgi:hypothetical protein
VKTRASSTAAEAADLAAIIEQLRAQLPAASNKPA